MGSVLAWLLLLTAGFGDPFSCKNNCSPLQLLPMALDGCFVSSSDSSDTSQALEEKFSSVQHLSVDGHWVQLQVT